MSVCLHVLAAAKDAVHHDCSWGRALTHLLLTPSHQGPLYQLIGLQMVQLAYSYSKHIACLQQTETHLLHATARHTTTVQQEDHYVSTQNIPTNLRR